MPKSDDQEFWELLNRIDAEAAQAPEAQGGEGFGHGPDFPDGEKPMLYKNYSNGYGRDIRNYSNGYGQGQAQPQSQPHAQPIRAYNADFRSTGERVRVNHGDYPPAPAKSRAAKASIPAAPGKKRRKGHGCLTSLLVLLTLVGLLIGGMFLFLKPPKTDQPIGTRKPGASAVLLCGADVGGVRTDTMMLLYVDSVNKEAGLLSLPRDTYTRTAYGLDVKLNSAYGRNDGGEEGMQVLLDYVQDILGYRPDGYVLVELPALEELVNLMGGVEFDVPTNITFQDPGMNLDINLAPGLQHLDGRQALGLVRFRYGYYNQDLGRADTQKAFLKACMTQWMKPSNLGKLEEVMDLFRQKSLNSLSTGNYLWFAVQLLRCGPKNLRMDTLPGYADYIGDQSFYVLDPDGVVELVNEYYNPYRQPITRDGVHIVTED